MQKLHLQASEKRNSFSATHQQAVVQLLLGKWDLSKCNACLERKTSSPLPPPFPEILLLSMTLHSMGYCYVQFGSTVPTVSSPNLSPTPFLLAFMGESVE